MKTVADKLRNSIQYSLGVMDSGSGEFKELSNKIDELFELSYLEGQSSPKIKQLEWEESDGEYWEAITPIGTYSITFDFGVYVTLYDMDNVVDGEWRSLAKAKIACNNDFEKRVMECLNL